MNTTILKINNKLWDWFRTYCIYNFGFRETTGCMSAYYEKDGIWIDIDYSISLDFGYNEELLDKLKATSVDLDGVLEKLIVEIEKEGDNNE